MPQVNPNKNTCSKSGNSRKFSARWLAYKLHPVHRIAMLVASYVRPEPKMYHLLWHMLTEPHLGPHLGVHTKGHICSDFSIFDHPNSTAMPGFFPKWQFRYHLSFGLLFGRSKKNGIFEPSRPQLVFPFFGAAPRAPRPTKTPDSRDRDGPSRRIGSPPKGWT